MKHTLRVFGRLSVLALILLLLPACGGEPIPETTAPITTSPPTTVVPSTEALQYRVVLPQSLEVHCPQTPESPARWHAQTTVQVVPDSDYGLLYPYIGRVNGIAWDYHVSPRYGFCTEDGVLVTDPWYNAVSVVSLGDESLYWCEKYREYDVESVQDTSVTLMNLDGSQVTHWDAARRVTGAANTPDSHYTYDWWPEMDYITVYKDGKWGLIDYQMNQILPCEYPSPLFFTGKYAPVLAEAGDSYSYIDIMGRQALGPYAVDESDDFWNFYFDSGDALHPVEQYIFTDGRARFCRDGLVGLIDEKGRVTAEPVYPMMSLCFQGFAMVMDENWRIGLISRDGVVALEPLECGWLETTAHGWAVIDGAEDITIGLDGKPLPEGTPVTHYIGNGAYVIRPEIGQPATIYIDGRIVGSVPWGGYLHYLGDGLFHDVNDTVFDLEGNTFWVQPASYLGLWHGLLINWEWLDYGQQATLYSREDGQFEFLAGPFEEADVYDHCIAVQNGSWGGVIDRQGNWIVKVSLLDSLPD